jgi:hypothetical protein
MFSTNKNRENVVGKSRSPLLFVLYLSLSHFSLSRPVFIQESVFESSMADTSRAAFLQARQCWPERGREELIPASAKSIYEAWLAASPDARRLAIDAAVASGLTRAPGKDTERAQCRDLTLFGSPLPGPQSALRPLTTAQVQALGVVPTSAARHRRSDGPPARSLSEPLPPRQDRGRRTARADAEVVQEIRDPPSSPHGGGSPEKRLRGGALEPLPSLSFARPLPIAGVRTV